MPTDSYPLLMFAAGFGTRMRPLTDDRPKPLIEVAGRPLIDHALALGQAAGCAPIAANLHYRAGMLDRHLAPQGVVTVTETPDILDTGGGLKNALPLLGEGAVVTMNTDAIWAGPNPIGLLMEAWRPETMDALLICLDPEDAVGHAGAGDFRMDSDGRLTRGPGFVFGGVQIIRAGLVRDMPERVFSLNAVWDRIGAEGRLFGLRYPGKWCDVGHPGGIALAEDLLRQSHV